MFFSILYISPKGAEVLFSFHHFPSNSPDFLFDLLFEMLFLSGPGDLRTLWKQNQSFQHAKSMPTTHIPF